MMTYVAWGWMLSLDVSKNLLGLIDPTVEGHIILRHVTNHSPNETESYPRGLESSATPVR
jgi:hypothetical protein